MTGTDNKMHTIANVFSRLDNRLIHYVRNEYLQSDKKAEFKLHSYFTVGAIFMTDWFFFIEGQYFQFLKDVMMTYNVVLVLFCLALYVAAFYCWRVLFNLRSEGINKDKNLFFAESAALYRKIVFYSALIPWFILENYNKLQIEDVGENMKILKYALRSGFYRVSGLYIVESVLSSIVIIEIIRIFFVRTSPWSNKTHFVVVFFVALSLAAIRVALLSVAIRR